ncbi:hypothetical protein ACFE04_008369 [Oxalis oulophora]
MSQQGLYKDLCVVSLPFYGRELPRASWGNWIIVPSFGYIGRADHLCSLAILFDRARSSHLLVVVNTENMNSLSALDHRRMAKFLSLSESTTTLIRGFEPIGGSSNDRSVGRAGNSMRLSG